MIKKKIYFCNPAVEPRCVDMNGMQVFLSKIVAFLRRSGIDILLGGQTCCYLSIQAGPIHSDWKLALLQMRGGY